MRKINWVEVDEKSRTYHFPSESFTFKNVWRIEVRESGKHRLETRDGRKAFVNTGWTVLEIDTEKWTF